MRENIRCLISTGISGVFLIVALGLTMHFFPVRLETINDKQVLIVATRCWRTLQPGDLIMDEEGNLVGITESESQRPEEVMKNILQSKETRERVLFTSAEGVL